MDDMIFLISGYAVFIGVTLVYVLSLVNRQRGLQQEIESIQTIRDEE
jgi:hypothetical protein